MSEIFVNCANSVIENYVNYENIYIFVNVYAVDCNWLFCIVVGVNYIRGCINLIGIVSVLVK